MLSVVVPGEEDAPLLLPHASLVRPHPESLVGVIVVLDQLVWRPLLAWSTRFKLEMVAGAAVPASWFYRVLCQSRLIRACHHAVRRVMIQLDVTLLGQFPLPVRAAAPPRG